MSDDTFLVALYCLGMGIWKEYKSMCKITSRAYKAYFTTTRKFKFRLTTNAVVDIDFADAIRREYFTYVLSNGYLEITHKGFKEARRKLRKWKSSDEAGIIEFLGTDPVIKDRYNSMVTVQLTPKGFDFVRKRIRELVKDKEIIVADALCGDTLSEDVYKAWEGSVNKELLINDSTVKMEWRGTWKT